MRLLLIFWLLLIIALSLIPLDLKNELGTTGKLHQLGHYGAFLITAALLCWDANSLSHKILRCSGAFALGFTLEALEVLFYRNRFEWADVGTDSLGILSGCLFVILLKALAPGLRRQAPENR